MLAMVPLRCALLLVAIASSACSTVAPAARTDGFEADGVGVRHLRLRIAPAHTGDFEAVMARCVRAADEAGLSDAHDWLCYRESPGRYWIVTFEGDDGAFAIPSSQQPLRTFVGHLAGPEGETELAAIEYEVEWAALTRQKREWSTVESMSTATHPKARIMLRTVRPGEEAAFERALAARTAFLLERDYPLPVEGFVVLSGLPGTAMQVVFPRDWPSFHGGESFWEFVQGLPEEERAVYLELKADLMRTMASAEYYDGDYVEGASRG